MNGKILVLSDIHGNLNALSSVLGDVKKRGDVAACMLLGDLVDYGMRSNEVVDLIRGLPYPVLCNIRGNHEDAVLRDDYRRFSSDRGRDSARHTRATLDGRTWQYLREVMEPSGTSAFTVNGKKFLAVHGSLPDEYWTSITPDTDPAPYAGYDFVFSGHSHRPHFFERYYPADDPARRNVKKTIFVNPGSVGQPRNLNNRAQYALFDPETEALSFVTAEYDIEGEQETFSGSPVDPFYRERLKRGI